MTGFYMMGTLMVKRLSNPFQRTPINGSFSNWAEISAGEPQDSVRSPVV